MKINEFQVVKLEMEGFKIANEKVTHLFGKHNVITGDNRKGKSTIMDAIAFCLYGVTAKGESRLTKYFFNNNGTCKKVVVNLTIRVGEDLHLITRKLTPSSVTISFDLDKVTQEFLDETFGEKDLFLSQWNPTYYLGLDEDNLRSILTRIVPQPSEERILKKLSVECRALLPDSGLSDPTYYLKKLRIDAGELEKSKLKLEGQIQGIKLEIDIPAEVEVNETEIKVVKSSIDKLIASKIDVSAYVQQKRALEEQISKLNLLYPTTSVSILNVARNNLLANYATKKQSIKKESFDTPICTECGQVLPKKMVEHLISVTKESNKVIIQELAEVKKSGIAIANQILEQEKKNEENLKQKEIQRKTLENDLRVISTKTTNDKNGQIDHQVDVLRTKLALLEKEKMVAVAGNSKRKTLLELLENNKKEKVLLTETLATKDKDMLNITNKISATKQYISERSKILSGLLQANLSMVTIVLEKVNQSTGEVTPCFDFTYAGVVDKMFSGSERINAGLEVGNLIRKFTGTNFPTFIDESNIITSPYETTANQTFEAYAVKEKPLTVTIFEDSVAKKITKAAGVKNTNKNKEIPLDIVEPEYTQQTLLAM